MRGRKAVVNTLCAFLQEIVAVICAFILPRLILSNYGSKANGLVQSITQFLGYMAILRFGLGGATRAALYKPLAEGDKHSIDAIMCATRLYMRKIIVIIVVAILALAFFYPFITRNEYEWVYSFSLFVIIGTSTIVENVFGTPNLILLQADQRLYISSLSRIISTILNITVVVGMIKMDASLHLVEMGSVLTICLYPLLLMMYVKRKYNINNNEEPDYHAIRKINITFFHHAAQFVMGNTDVVLISLFLPLTEVSVYSIYNLVATGLQKIVMNFTNGLEAAFGDMFAKGECELLNRNFRIIEVLVFDIAIVTYSSAAILILPFVNLYTSGINDAEYYRPVFAMLFVIAQFFLCIRQPYRLLVQATGMYKETLRGAILEPVFNIAISVIAIKMVGIIGVLIGTLISVIYRTVDFSVFVSKHIVKETFQMLLKLLASSMAEVLVMFIFDRFVLGPSKVDGYIQWCFMGIRTVLVAATTTGLISYLLFRYETLQLIRKIRNIVLTHKKGETN